MITKSRKRPFKTNIIVLFIFILDKLFVFLVQRIVGQVNIFVVLVQFGWIRFWCKPCKTLFEYIYSQWFIWSYNNIDSQIEFVTVDKQRIWDISRNYACLINIKFIDVFNQVDAFSLRRIGRLDNPDIALWLSLFQFIIMCLEFMKLIWQNISIRDEIELWAPIFLLHLQNVMAKSIFPRDFIALWEMIDSLKLIETFIEETFAWAWGPEDVPLMWLSIAEVIRFKNWTH